MAFKKRLFGLERAWSWIKNQEQRFRLFYILASLLFIVWFYGARLPNFLGLKSFDVALQVLSVIIGSLASILAIIVAITLVSFQVLRSYTNLAYKSIFQNKKIIEFFILYISTIVISLITLLTLNNPIGKSSLALIYTSVYLFFLSIGILFPYSKDIIVFSELLQPIKRLIEEIDLGARLPARGRA